MKLRVCVELETKDLPFSEIQEALDIAHQLTEKDFDSSAAGIAESMERQIMASDSEHFEKVKITLVRAGR
ncbi:MAG: hypothetical protein V3T43_02755 [Nitrosomonadaceae bacterium]